MIPTVLRRGQEGTAWPHCGAGLLSPRPLVRPRTAAGVENSRVGPGESEPLPQPSGEARRVPRCLGDAGPVRPGVGRGGTVALARRAGQRGY
jgi:hypothetical protein